MAYDIVLENTTGVPPDCLARGIDLVVTELPDRLIETIWFGSDFLGVELFGERRIFDFPVIRGGDSNDH